MTGRVSVEGDLLRHACRHLLAELPEVPGAVTRRLLALARDYDQAAHRPPVVAPSLAGRWVRRARGNAGPGVPGIAHVAADRSAGLGDATAVCGTALRGRLDWAYPALPGNAGDGWRPCRACARHLLPTATVTDLTARRTA